jgi:outer membrane protein assembly factor BamA
MELNNVNSDLLPTRGVLWNTQLTALAGITNTSKPLTQLTSDLTLYSPLAGVDKLVSVLKIGGGHIYSKNYEYFQALNLGQNNVLRGFRKNRFAGSGLAYGSLELRAKLFNSKSYYFPGPVGLIGYGEAGRVWVRNEESKKWHPSYGGGIYYAPFNAAIVAGTIGFSPEEKIFNFSIGTKFNINF